jgi:hypothetical protein
MGFQKHGHFKRSGCFMQSEEILIAANNSSIASNALDPRQSHYAETFANGFLERRREPINA